VARRSRPTGELTVPGPASDGLPTWQTSRSHLLSQFCNEHHCLRIRRNDGAAGPTGRLMAGCQAAPCASSSSTNRVDPEKSPANTRTAPSIFPSKMVRMRYSRYRHYNWSGDQQRSASPIGFVGMGVLGCA
jgi:hypothetical protein